MSSIRPNENENVSGEIPEHNQHSVEVDGESSDNNIGTETTDKGRWPSLLHRLVTEQSGDEWSTVIERIRSNPEELVNEGIYGQTSLHSACVNYPPLNVVEEMIAASRQIASIQNKDGETPLHLATYGASEDVQSTLIDAAPESVGYVDKYGDSSLHLAIKSGATYGLISKMVTVCPQCITLQNNRGVTPFWLLSRKYIEATRLDQLEEIENISNGSSNDEYIDDWKTSILFLKTHADVTLSWPKSQITSNITCNRNSNKQIQRNNGNKCDASSSSNKTSKTLIETIEEDGAGAGKRDGRTKENSVYPIFDEKDDDSCNNGFRIAHAAASCPACPRDLMMIICKFYPEEALKYDEHGMTPLSYSCITDVIKEPKTWDEAEDGYREDIEMASVFDDESISDTDNHGNSDHTLAELHDSLTSHRSNFEATLLLDGEGENEFNDAESQNHGINIKIPSGVGDGDDDLSIVNMLARWNPRAARKADRDGRLPLTHAIMSGKTWKNAIRQVLIAAPRALETRDAITRFFPFQLAATYSSDMNACYCLLRSLPELVSTGIDGHGSDSFGAGVVEDEDEDWREIQQPKKKR